MAFPDYGRGAGLIWVGAAAVVLLSALVFVGFLVGAFFLVRWLFF